MLLFIYVYKYNENFVISVFCYKLLSLTALMLKGYGQI